MTRVSLEEQYNNKDVITQILKMRDDIARIAANAAGIQDITLTTTATGWKFTFTLTDGTSYVFPLDTTGYITDAELAAALADYYTKTEIDNAFADYYTKSETDTALGAKADDNAVVKLTGAQTVGGVKTFSDSPTVPDAPATEHSAVNQDWAENVAYVDDTVNNLVHKEGNEKIKGSKEILGGLLNANHYSTVHNVPAGTARYLHIADVKNTERFNIGFITSTLGGFGFLTWFHNQNGTDNGQFVLTDLSGTSTSYVTGLDFVTLQNAITGNRELWLVGTGYTFRMYFDLFKIGKNNNDASSSDLTVVNTYSNTNPVSDTATYPNGIEATFYKKIIDS